MASKKSLETGGGLDFLSKGDFIKALLPLFLSVQNYAKRKFAEAVEFTKTAVAQSAEKVTSEAKSYTDASVKEVSETVTKQVSTVRSELSADIAKVGADASSRISDIDAKVNQGFASGAEVDYQLQQQVNQLKAGRDSVVITDETFDVVNSRIIEEVAKEYDTQLKVDGVYAILNNTKQTLYLVSSETGEKVEVPSRKTLVAAFDIKGQRTYFIDPSDAEKLDAILFEKAVATFATKEDVLEVSVQAAAEKVSLFDASTEILKQLESEQ